jgi:hypothetical protein
MSLKTDNGPARTTLAEQIDRLDGVIDALSVGLNEAVASAVQGVVGQAVREAVQAVIAELLGSPQVLALLRPATPPAPEPAAAEPRRPGLLRRLLWGACGWASSAWGGLRGVWGRTTGLARGAVGLASSAWALARPHRRPLLLALAVGTATGVAAYFAGPWLAAAAGGLAGALATLVGYVALGTRQLLGVQTGA